MKIEESIIINKPVEAVFAFITTPEKSPKWQSGAIETIRTSDGPIGVGSTMRHIGKFMGRRIETIAKVSAFELGRKYAYYSQLGPTKFSLCYTFEPKEDGVATRLTLATEAALRGGFRLMGPMVRAMTSRRYRGDLQRVKSILEKQT